MSSNFEIVQTLTSRDTIPRTTRHIISTAADIETRATDTKALAQQFQKTHKNLECATTVQQEDQLTQVKKTFKANEKSQAIIALMGNFLTIVSSDRLSKLRKHLD